MRCLRFATISLIVISLAVSAAVAARTSVKRDRTPPTIAYALDASSAYMFGCFPSGPLPCGGAVFEALSFDGGFAATLAGIDQNGFLITKLTNVELTAHFGEGQIDIVAEGVYFRGTGPDPMHQLILEVENGGDTLVFDSGLVPVPNSPHVIDIQVSVNGAAGYDTVMTIVADPAIFVHVQTGTPSHSTGE